MARVPPGSPPPTDLLDRVWTPVAHTAARLELVAGEEPGSMQHFTTVLLLSDLLARLHATFLVSVVAQFEQSVSQRHAYSLVRASSAGYWLDAIRESSALLRRFELGPDLERIVKWPANPPESAEAKEGFFPIAQALADLAAALQLRDTRPIKQPPRWILFGLLVEVRNKTVHGAYESRFYADHVRVIESAVRWLLRESPLWEVELMQMTTRTRGRLLHGSLLTQSKSLTREFRRDDLVFTLGGEAWPAAPLIHARDGYTYLANGTWRESNSTAEFLCHSLAATEPGQGTMRVELPDLARPPLPSIGQVVDGHYRIAEILGEGADAVVYLATDTQEGTEYVLKAFREPRESFDQRRVEFSALQQINHANVPCVHEIHGWEHPFHLRMDYIAGAALLARRAEFQGDATAVAQLGAALCEALDAVHAAGFVHRDVAPDNVMIPDNPSDPVRLVDFDLVAPLDTVGPAGKPLYRPPESESAGPWTRASDVYSLGVVLFELLTGRLPNKTREDTTERHPVEPSANELAAFGDVIQVLQKAAALDPRARYATARGFLRALRTAARTITVQTDTPVAQTKGK